MSQDDMDTSKPTVTIPTPPHPIHRQEKLPWQTPKPPEEDVEAQARVEALLRSESYRQADEDIDFLGARCEPRGAPAARLQQAATPAEPARRAPYDCGLRQHPHHGARRRRPEGGSPEPGAAPTHRKTAI